MRNTPAWAGEFTIYALRFTIYESQFLRQPRMKRERINRKSKMAPEICPNCAADVPRNAKSCPDCGSDEKIGWSDSAHADNLGIPDEHFDYDKFVKEEFAPEPAKPRGIP